MAILLELQARGGLRAEDLARTFEVSLRTIYRDMEALSETGVPVVATPGKGYRLMEGYFLPPLSFTSAEAALLLLGGEYVRDRVDPELRRAADDALRKLAGVLHPERREEIARRRDELLFTGSDAGDDPMVAAVRAAIEQQRALRLLYHAYRREQPEPRVVEPVKLVYLADAWHLAAYCRARQASRLFRLDRIDALEPLAERFTLGARHAVGPDPVEVWDDFPVARVRLDPAARRWALERPPYFFRRVEETDDGPILILSLRDEPALLSWLLGWGSAVTVLEPPSLRARLAREARAVLLRHTDRAEFGEHPERAELPATTVSGAPR
jgi:predicted DNA-binding transcriptional regulator YafY